MGNICLQVNKTEVLAVHDLPCVLLHRLAILELVIYEAFVHSKSQSLVIYEPFVRSKSQKFRGLVGPNPGPIESLRSSKSQNLVIYEAFVNSKSQSLVIYETFVRSKSQKI